MTPATPAIVFKCPYCKCEDQSMLEVYYRKEEPSIRVFCSQCGKTWGLYSNGETHPSVPEADNR